MGADPAAYPLPDPGLVAAYRRARYRILEPEVVLHIDVQSPALARLHRECGVVCSALITACNPFSQILAAADNAAHQATLCATLQGLGWGGRPAQGEDPQGRWPVEPMYWVAGLDCEAARALGRRFGQYAVVCAGVDAVPRLAACAP